MINIIIYYICRVDTYSRIDDRQQCNSIHHFYFTNDSTVSIYTTYYRYVFAIEHNLASFNLM